LFFFPFFFFYLLYGYGMLQLSRWEPWRHFSSIFCFSPLFCSTNTSQTRSYLLTTKLTNNRSCGGGNWIQ
jgi:hypothetical protein